MHSAAGATAYPDSDSSIQDGFTYPVYPQEGAKHQKAQFEQNPDQQISEKKSYREIMRGVCSYMGWHQVPDLDRQASFQDDNPFAGSRKPAAGRISVKLPSDDWLCQKLEKLNLSLTEWNSIHSTDTSGLYKDQFFKIPKSQKWYNVQSERKDFSKSKVHYWHNEPANINNAFPRIARFSLT